MDIVKTKIPKIIDVRAIGPLELLIVYDDKQKKTFNVAPYIKLFKAFEPLLDEKTFKQVHTNRLGDALIWNENIDISGYDVWEVGSSLS